MKSGIDFFPLDVNMDEKVELIEAEFGLTGFAILVKLLQRIYGGEGWYVEWTNEVALLFAKKVGVGGNVVSEIVTALIKRGIFDKTLYDKYHILTSAGIQRRYFEAVRRRKSVKVISEYLLFNVTDFLSDVDILSKNVCKNSKNVDISAQSRVKESKIKENNYYNSCSRCSSKKEKDDSTLDDAVLNDREDTSLESVAERDSYGEPCIADEQENEFPVDGEEYLQDDNNSEDCNGKSAIYQFEELSFGVAEDMKKSTNGNYPSYWQNRNAEKDKPLRTLTGSNTANGNAAHDDWITAYSDFVKRWDIKVDNYSAIVKEYDYKALSEAYSNSKWLRAQVFTHCLSWICKNYNSIVAGRWTDFKDVKKDVVIDNDGDDDEDECDPPERIEKFLRERPGQDGYLQCGFIKNGVYHTLSEFEKAYPNWREIREKTGKTFYEIWED